MRIDLDRMDALSASIGNVHASFQDAEKLTDDWRGAVGHDGLAGKLEDFSGNWDDTRENMLEGIENMGKLAGEIAKAFRDTDQQLADGLEQANQPTPASPTGPR